MKTRLWRLMPFLVFLVLALFLWRGLSLDPQALPLAQLNRQVPDFHLPVLGDNQQHFDAKQLRGKITLLNVWASWCAACVDEQLFLMQLAEQGIAIFGLNYKDNNQNALKWLHQWGNPYRLIGDDKDGSVAIDLGVYGAPETFLIDSNGFIRFRHVGIMTKESWDKDFLPRIQQLKDSQ